MTAALDAPGRTDTVLPEAVAIACRDGHRLHVHLWHPARGQEPVHGTVIVNPATGVLGRYYHSERNIS